MGEERKTYKKRNRNNTMSNKLLNYATSPMFVVFLLLGFIVVGCGDKAVSPVANNSAQKAAPQESLQEFRCVKTEKGAKIWELTAEKANIFAEENKTWINDLKIKFFNGEHKNSLLTAKEGWLTRDSNIEVTGHVVVVSDSSKIRLETEELQWSAEKGIIFTDQPVKVIEENRTITGVGLEATPDLESIKIKKQQVEIKNKKLKR